MGGFVKKLHRRLAANAYTLPTTGERQRMGHLTKAIIVLVVGTGTACGRDPSPDDTSTRLSAARSFIAAAAKEVHKTTDDGDREYLLYELAGMQAMVGDIDGAKATACSCTVHGRRSEAYRYVGELQGALGDNEGAKHTLVLARKAGLAALSSTRKERSWTGIGLVAVEQARIGDFQGASETLQFIEDAKSREEYLTVVAHFQTAPEARRTTGNVKDPVQKDLAMLDIVGAQLQSGDRTAAWASAKEIVDLGLRVSAYVRIAETCDNTTEGKRAYAQAKATVEEIRRIESKGDFSIVPAPGDREFREIVKSQAQNSDVSEAKATAALIRDSTEKATSFVDIARAQLQISDRQGARATLANAVAARATAADDYTFMTELVTALAQAGELAEAMKTISLMGEKGESKDHAYEKIIDVLLDDHRIKQAKETVAFILDSRWKATALARIGAVESSVSGFPTARKTFAEARSIATTAAARNRESWTWDRSSVFDYIAMRQSETGDFEEIKRWVPLLQEPRDRVSAWLGAAWPLAYQYHDENQKRMARTREHDAATRPKVQ